MQFAVCSPPSPPFNFKIQNPNLKYYRNNFIFELEIVNLKFTIFNIQFEFEIKLGFRTKEGGGVGYCKPKTTN